MKFTFDSQHNPHPMTLVLAKKDGTKLGALPAHHLKVAPEFNSAWSLEFSVYKQECDIWDDIIDFKLLWLKEFDLWFEIHLQTSDGNVCVKHVSAKSLAEAELSQTKLFKIEINTEIDIERDDYKPTIFYNTTDKSCSLLDRILSKTPHYSVVSVQTSLRNIQRTFSFDSTSVYDALQEVSQEIGCYFDFAVHSDENGKPKRAFSVYDLQSYCLECEARGDFRNICEECGSDNVVNGYGNDTQIFVSTQNLTDEVVFETNEDSVKNCFKLESGDELMDAAIVSCNPNGSSYLWHIPEFMKKDMPDELVAKVNDYNELFEYYQSEHISSLEADCVTKYNDLIERYVTYNSKLTPTPSSIVGFPALMNEYYNTIDFKLMLQSSLMPSIETIETTAVEQASRLTTERLSPVAVYSMDTASSSTVDSAVLAMAKAQIDYRYQVKIISSSYSEQTWTGSFVVTNYYNEEDSANSSVMSISIVDNYESYVSQMLDKSLSDTTDYSTDIVIMFKLGESEFIAELKKYSLSRLMAFDKSCEACSNILIEHGAANKETWNNSSENLYDDLYAPYRRKQEYIQNEIKLRESEIAIIEDVQAQILANRGQIQNALNFENYIGTDLWLTFIAYRREDVYSNPNYISDGLDNAELFSRALEFIEVAKENLYKSANLQHSLSATLKNLLVMKEFDGLTDNFELGNFIHVKCDEKIYDVRLLTFEIDFDNLGELPVTFSDVHEVNNDITDIKNVLDNSKSMASSYDNVAHQATQGNSSRKQLDDWTTNGLALTALKIVNSAENQDYVFDEHGMLFRKYLPLSGTYSDEQLKIINSTMAITNDNWETVKTAVGGHYYIDPLTNQLTYAYGINGEVLIGKIILGEQLGIYNSGATLQFNKNGLYITNGTNSFTLNPNTDENLLSIKSGVNDVLTVSSSGLYVKGEIFATSGYIGSESGWTIKSTYIYNGKSSLSDTTQGVYIGTDGISIGSGSAVFKVTNTGQITLTGYATTKELSSGTTTIDGGCIKTGTIDAERLNVSNIITVGDLATSSSVVSIINGTVTADFINTNVLSTSALIIKNPNGYELFRAGGNAVKIGGWTVDSNSLYHGDTFSKSDAFVCSTGSTAGFIIGNRTEEISGLVFRAGNNFGVTLEGKLYCSNADISGKVVSNEGVIANWAIDAQGLWSGNNIEDADIFLSPKGFEYGWNIGGKYITDLCIKIGKKFGITPEGVLHCSDSYIGHLQSQGDTGTALLRHGSLYLSNDGDLSDPLEAGTIISEGRIHFAGSGNMALGIYLQSDGTIAMGGTWTNMGGIPVTYSDANLKNSIETIDDRYDILFDNLISKRFKYNNGQSGRYHTGYITQDVQAALQKAEIDESEFAAICTLQQGTDQEWSGLRYGEFVSLNTWQIQKLKARVAELETIVAKLRGG